MFGFLVDEQDSRTILQEKKRIQNQSKPMLDPGQIQVIIERTDHVRGFRGWSAFPVERPGKQRESRSQRGGFRRQPGSGGAVLGSGGLTGSGSGTAV